MTNKKQAVKHQSGLTWTQIFLIIAVVFGVLQAQENRKLRDQFNKCICNWDQVVEMVTKYTE